MKNSDPREALGAHDQPTRRNHLEAMAVWTTLAKAEPELAAEILRLFSTVEAAASWVSTPVDDLEGSPAQLIAEGRASEIISMVRKTAHGFVG